MITWAFYEVGGKIRDELLRLRSNDVDYTAVASNVPDGFSPLVLFNELELFLREKGFDIFQVIPDCFTIKGKFPKGHKYSGVADFVMARKEVGYRPGSRTPIVEVGTLEDDLKRRDFTVNAMAKDYHGNIIDPFNGRIDLAAKNLDTPIDPLLSFIDDPLRILRAYRFSATKGLMIGQRVKKAISVFPVELFTQKVSKERIMVELAKMFKTHPKESIVALSDLKDLNRSLFEAILPDDFWFIPTNRKK